MSSFCKCKSYSHFFSKSINVYAIFNDQSFNDVLTNDILSFEQLVPAKYFSCNSRKTYVVGTHKKYLNEALLVSTHNIYFGGEINMSKEFLDKKKMFPILSHVV